MDGSGVHDANVKFFLDEGIGGAEVIELLELGADVGGGDQPVGRAAECGPVDDVRDLECFVEERDVPVGEVDGGTGGRGEVVGRTDGCCNNQVVDNLPVDLGDHFVGHKVGEGGFGVDVVDGLEILGGFKAPGGLELTSDGGDGVAVDAQGDFWLEWVGFEVVFVVESCDCAGG